MQTITTLAVRFGLKRAEIFGCMPPHPNPHRYPTNPAGVPIVPRDDVRTGLGGKVVFDGGQITTASGARTFIVRTEFGAPTLRPGDRFAFANTESHRPALVYEVVEVDRGNGADTVETQDVGFLSDDSPITEVEQ